MITTRRQLRSLDNDFEEEVHRLTVLQDKVSELRLHDYDIDQTERLPSVGRNPQYQLDVDEEARAAENDRKRQAIGLDLLILRVEYHKVLSSSHTAAQAEDRGYIASVLKKRIDDLNVTPGEIPSNKAQRVLGVLENIE